MLLNQWIREKDHKKNFFLLLWHSFFFMLTINLLDKDTILPGMLSKMGAGEILIGLLSVITIGLPKFSQIFFGLVLQNKPTRKKHLLEGFSIRISSLLAIAYVLWLYYLFRISSAQAITLIMSLFFVYSLAAAYTSVGIIDMAPRALFRHTLKRFYSLKQVGNGIGIILAIMLVRPVLKMFPFPFNYSLLHILGGLSLVISTLAIIGLKEKIIVTKARFTIKTYLRFVYQELRTNKSLLFLSLIVNSEGLFLSIIPFFTTLAISKFAVNARLISSLFMWKILGVLVSSIFLTAKRNYDYFKVLAANIFISILAPVILIIFANHVAIYKVVFFMVGVFNSFYRITFEGLLVEISNDKNRATYASVLGSSNVSTFIIPLVSGGMIKALGYNVTFIFSAVILAFTIIFMLKLRELIKPAIAQ